MKTKPYRWTRYRKSLKSTLENGTHTATSLFAYVKQVRRKAAKEQSWRASELACSLAMDREEINEVARRLGLPEIED